MKGWRIGAWIITLVALVTIIGPYLADWNETHIYNPRWPPHAKYHNAQTMAFGALLGSLALYFLWGRLRKSDERSNVSLAVVFAALYWAAQLLAFFFPGVAAFDPEFAATAPPRLLGLPGQLGLDIIIIFALLGTAFQKAENRFAGEYQVRSRLHFTSRAFKTDDACFNLRKSLYRFRPKFPTNPRLFVATKRCFRVDLKNRIAPNVPYLKRVHHSMHPRDVFCPNRCG